MAAARQDVIIVGGGLAGGLAALALRRRRPEVAVTIVEAGERIGGNHLWSYFASDIADRDAELLDGLTAHRWPSYSVRFPAYEKSIDEPYSTIESEALDDAVRRAGVAVVRAEAATVGTTRVVLTDGPELEAAAVIDARGIAASPRGMICGWQKFLGQLIDVEGGHGFATPVVMDATVEQLDGYRFIYLLPFDDHRLFVEDTYYSDRPELDEATLTLRITAFLRAQGWAATSVSRTERGVLPVVTAGDFDAVWPAEDRVARAGVRAGLFHPVTSYSLPDAVRFASWLADQALDESLGEATRLYAARHWRRTRFERMLARMMMQAAEPAARYKVLERFYRLPTPLIARFYAGRSTFADRVRILSGKPPVPIAAAARAMIGGRA